MKNYWNAIRQFDRSINLYMVYWFMISFAYFGIVAVLMNLYLLRLGYGPEFIGLVLGSGQLVWAAFALPAGAIGSRFGAKQAMTAGMVIIATGTALMLAAEMLPPALRPAGLVLAWMTSWIGAALGAVNSAPYLMAVTDEKTRGFAFSAQQTVMAAAGFAGSVAAGILPGVIAGRLGLSLENPAPYRLALLLAPAAYLIGAYAMSRAKPAGMIVQTGKTAKAPRVPVGLFLFLGIVISLQSFSEGTVRAFFNVYLDTTLHLPTGQIGGIMGASQLLLILISFAVPAILARWGTGGSLTIMTFVLSAFVFLLASAPIVSVAAGAYMGINGVLMVMATSRGIYTQEVVDLRWRMMISAVSTVGLAIGWASAAWLGGSLVQTIGFKGVFILGALLALLSGGLLLARMYSERKSGYGTTPMAELEPAEAQEGC